MSFYELDIIGNCRGITPEQIVDFYEVGLINNADKKFVENIISEQETVKPVMFDTFKGLVYVMDKANVSQKNTRTELIDKIRNLMDFYGDKFSSVSTSRIVRLLNEVLNAGEVISLDNVELKKMLGTIAIDGNISLNRIEVKSNEPLIKQK